MKNLYVTCTLYMLFVPDGKSLPKQLSFRLQNIPGFRAKIFLGPIE